MGRIGWIDYAKGWGIGLVVLGHTLRGLVNAKLMGESPAFALADAWIYAFHMPLFFFLSGIFAERLAGRPPARFAADRVGTIVYPYLLWSTIQILLMIALGGQTNADVGTGDLARVLVEPIMHFWFLYALLLISGLYYLLRSLGLGPAGCLVAFSALWVARGWADQVPWTPLASACKFGPYFALGAVATARGSLPALDSWPAWRLWAAPPAAFLAMTALLLGGGAPPTLLAAALCGIAGSVALSVLVARSGRARVVRTLGEASLEIFLAHTIVSAGLRIALAKVLHFRDVPAHIVVGTLGGLFVPIALAVASRRLGLAGLFRLKLEPGQARVATPAVATR